MWLNADTDPAFNSMLIQIQLYRSMLTQILSFFIVEAKISLFQNSSRPRTKSLIIIWRGAYRTSLIFKSSLVWWKDGPIDSPYSFRPNRGENGEYNIYLGWGILYPSAPLLQNIFPRFLFAYFLGYKNLQNVTVIVPKKSMSNIVTTVPTNELILGISGLLESAC